MANLWQLLIHHKCIPSAHGTSNKVVAMFSDIYSRAYHYEPVLMPNADASDHLPPEAGDLLEDLCGRIIADDIELIVFHLQGSSASRSYFQRCTNDSTRFYEIDGTNALGAALRDMISLGELRLIN